jgi:hypothetical protein
MALFLPLIIQVHQLPVSFSSPAILCVEPPHASPAPQALSIQGSSKFLYPQIQYQRYFSSVQERTLLEVVPDRRDSER